MALGVDPEGRCEVPQESRYVSSIVVCFAKSLTSLVLGLISLGGGLPSPEYFPFEELSIKVPTPPGFSPEETRETGTVLRAGKSDIRDGKSLYGKGTGLAVQPEYVLMQIRSGGCFELRSGYRVASAAPIRH